MGIFMGSNQLEGQTCSWFDIPMYVCCANKDSSHEVVANERRTVVWRETSPSGDRSGTGNMNI